MKKSENLEWVQERFLRDVAEHQLTIIRGNGVNRHIRFGQPGTRNYQFDLLTWPGHLCFTGDIGTYVFSRLDDMFEFFRTDRQYANPSNIDRWINPGYWAEKLLAVGSNGYGEGTIHEWDPEQFRSQLVRSFRGLSFRSHHERRECWDDLRVDILEEEEVFADRDAGMRAAMRFSLDGKRLFADFWEYSFNQFTVQYLWACHAIAWGIQQYDSQSTAAAA